MRAFFVDNIMKKILVTGLHSYTGSSVREYLSSWPDDYHSEAITLRGCSWKSESFRGFDTVIHTAGIAHDNSESGGAEAYYSVNSKLAFDTALKAMKDGVKQFIFLSSSTVYGKSSPPGQVKIIKRDSPLNPYGYYADSKVRAENLLMTLESENFKVCILRCPMIYGRNSRGNYPILSKFARFSPVFPNVHNTRSMLYVKNFSHFIKLMIDNDERGIFWPQNGEYSDIVKIVKLIAGYHKRDIFLLPLCNLPLKFLSRYSMFISKAFGSLAYDMDLSGYHENYRLYTLSESIKESENFLIKK